MNHHRNMTRRQFMMLMPAVISSIPGSVIRCSKLAGAATKLSGLEGVDRQVRGHGEHNGA